MTARIPQHPHRRFNPLTGEWVLVSPQRVERPWQGQLEELGPVEPTGWDPDCPLCPGNLRSGGQRNPPYTNTFVFTNDFPALRPQIGEDTTATDPLFRHQPARGTCRVVCFSPRHDLTLPEMSLIEIRRVIDLWGQQVAELQAHYRWIQVFENKGALQGCSNPHPHGQIWASDHLPTEAVKENDQQRGYERQFGGLLLMDYAQQEMQEGTRLVDVHEHWLALVPYWATWPFETLVLPRQRRISHLPQLTNAERDDLAGLLKTLLTRYDNLFQTAFPYSMGWHGSPGTRDHKHWQLHAHFYPPLLRSATVKKFMVGYELLGEPQRDLTPEHAAAQLRALPVQHYRAFAARSRQTSATRRPRA